ncbi:hypothetical protein QJS04_geneDACA014502 [Acorus gramineus]|uniref:Outer envelope membrane protein 7 n=1 Tax=Acorus gramineus TaxID=55184 RepID=A0AAV9AT19_ACOGR|nr:hypothetical protein QJS04_geneDACA014502 [Acorus gramineus]
MKNRERNQSLKASLVVFGGLLFGWMAIEMAFKPLLDKVRGAISKSDPSRDPDDDDGGDGASASAADPSSSSPPPPPPPSD